MTARHAPPARAPARFILLRSAVFHAGMTLLTLPFAVLALLVWPLPYALRYRVITQWSRLNLRWLELTCNLRYRVHGREHLPVTPAVVLCKHQSAWETLALQEILPPQTWVLKRELLRIPCFGWGLAALEPIAIDRGAGRNAIAQVVEQGRARLQAGRWVVVFPEGTRVPPGTHRRYKQGGGILAEQSGFPVVPIAHNAGLFWPRRGLAKRPGVIDLVIGPAIDSRGLAAADITARAESWIEAQSAALIARSSP